MSNAILNQLTELFPDVSEEFLSGIYNAYIDEGITVAELVDVILSFEVLPPRVVLDDHLESSTDGSNGSAQIQVSSSEVTSVQNSNVCELVENEAIQKSISQGDGLTSKDVVTENCNNSKVFDTTEVSVTEELSNAIKDNEPNNNCFKDNAQVKVECTSDPEINLIQSSNSVEGVNVNISATPDSNISSLEKCEPLSEDDDSSSPECSIKYLMEEPCVFGIDDISTQLMETEKVQESNREQFSNYNELSCNPLPHSTIATDMLLDDNGAVAKKSHSNLSQDCSIQFGSNCLAKRPTLRSCKVKNEEERLRRKLINQNRLLHSNFSEDCSIQFGSNCLAKRVTLRSCKVKNEEERLRRKLINQNRLLRDRQDKKATSVVCPSQFQNLDEKHALLCNIFTDANPDYLLDQCKLLTDQDKILTFISQNLELRNYPKIDIDKEERKLMEEFHCTIADFLEAIPDPVVEFSSAKYIRTGYEQNAEIYLKTRYNGIGDEEVKKRLSACRYNLTDVCTQMEREGRVPTPGVLDYTPLHHPANVFFHQEVWYIEHRNEIQEYLNSAVEAVRVQEEMNRPPPPPDEVFECEICAEEIVEYVKLGTCDGPRGHLFCVNCIKRSAEIRIGDGETTFPCLVNCGAFVPLPTVKELLPRNVFDKLMNRIQEEEIRKANIAGVETCPFCPYAYGPGDEQLFTCLNPDCMKYSCRICLKEDHSPDICEMFKNEDEERARLIIENKMTEAFMRTCYNCGKSFIKSTGCNKMVCTCGAKMCYVCRQPVEDYSHFNGEGGDAVGRCPLFSQDEDLHVRPVAATAQQVFNEIAANNPQLNLDPSKLIPK